MFMKRKSPTPRFPFSRLLLRPLPDISLAMWDLGPHSQHHCIKDMLPMKIYPCLSDPVRVKGGMSLRNGMWHGLRNDIIMWNVIYAEWPKE